MSLTQEQIKKLSINLSKISSENPKLGDNINDILKYMEMLNEVDTTGVIPTISVIETENKLRKDVLSNEKSQREELLACTNGKVVNHQIMIQDIMK